MFVPWLKSQCDLCAMYCVMVYGLLLASFCVLLWLLLVVLCVRVFNVFVCVVCDLLCGIVCFTCAVCLCLRVI